MAIALMVMMVVLGAIAALGLVGYLIDKSVDREED